MRTRTKTLGWILGGGALLFVAAWMFFGRDVRETPLVSNEVADSTAPHAPELAPSPVLPAGEPRVSEVQDAQERFLAHVAGILGPRHHP